MLIQNENHNGSGFVEYLDIYSDPCANCTDPCRERSGSDPESELDFGLIENLVFYQARHAIAPSTTSGTQSFFIVCLDNFTKAIKSRGYRPIADKSVRKEWKRRAVRFSKCVHNVAESLESSNCFPNLTVRQLINGLEKHVLECSEYIDTEVTEDNWFDIIKEDARAYHGTRGQKLGNAPTRLEQILFIQVALEALKEGPFIDKWKSTRLDFRGDNAASHPYCKGLYFQKDYLAQENILDVLYNEALKGNTQKDSQYTEKACASSQQTRPIETILDLNSAPYILAEHLVTANSQSELRTGQSLSSVLLPIKILGQYRFGVLWMYYSEEALKYRLQWEKRLEPICEERTRSDDTFEENYSFRSHIDQHFSNLLVDAFSLFLSSSIQNFKGSSKHRSLATCRRVQFAFSYLWVAEKIGLTRNGKVISWAHRNRWEQTNETRKHLVFHCSENGDRLPTHFLPPKITEKLSSLDDFSRPEIVIFDHLSSSLDSELKEEYQTFRGPMDRKPGCRLLCLRVTGNPDVAEVLGFDSVIYWCESMPDSPAQIEKKWKPVFMLLCEKLDQFCADTIRETINLTDKLEGEAAIKRQKLLGTMLHGSSNAVRMVRASDLCKTISRKIPPTRIEDLRFRVLHKKSDAPDDRSAQYLVDAARTALLGEDTAAALLALSEMQFNSDVVREKVMNEEPVAVVQLIHEAVEMINFRPIRQRSKRWKIDISINVESTQKEVSPPSPERWIFPKGYLSHKIIRGIFCELITNAGQHGKKILNENVPHVKLHIFFSGFLAGYLSCKFINEKQLSECSQTNRSLFLSVAPEMSKQLAGISIEVIDENKISSKNDKFGVQISFGKMKTESTGEFVFPELSKVD